MNAESNNNNQTVVDEVLELLPLKRQSAIQIVDLYDEYAEEVLSQGLVPIAFKDWFDAKSNTHAPIPFERHAAEPLEYIQYSEAVRSQGLTPIDLDSWLDAELNTNEPLPLERHAAEPLPIDD
jgi:hypothetical protein